MPVAPRVETVGDLLHRNHTVRLEQEDRQDGSLARTTDLIASSIIDDLDRAEHREIDAHPARTVTLRDSIGNVLGCSFPTVVSFRRHDQRGTRMSSRIPGLHRRLALASLVALAFGSALTAIALGSGRETYVSARYHYSLPVPAGLKLTPAKADQIYGLFPSAPSPEVDFFGAGPANDSRGIAVASVQLPTGTTLETWKRTNLQAIARQFSCHVPRQRRSRSTALLP